MSLINSFLRRIITQKYKKQLVNRDFSIISDNCVGGTISKDLGLQYRSPTVGLTILPDDYILFLSDLNKYLSCEIVFSDEEESKRHYPVGILDDKIKVYFIHYKTRAEAEEKWKRRAKRVNYDNIYITMTDRGSCDLKVLRQFDTLPYKKKVIFTKRKHTGSQSAYYLNGMEKWDQHGTVLEYSNIFSGKRHYEQFPVISWLNGEFSL